MDIKQPFTITEKIKANQQTTIKKLVCHELLLKSNPQHPRPLRTHTTRKLYALPTPRTVLYYIPVMAHRHHNIPYHPTTARRDNPQYEYATAVTPAPQSTRPDADTLPPPPEPTPAHEAAQMLRVVMSLIASACQSPLDAYYCVLRASGLSMEAIGKLDHNKSRIAVHKRLHKICRREPVLLDYLCNDRKGGKDA